MRGLFRRALGAPGTTSFAPFERTVLDAGGLETSVAALADAALVRTARAEAGDGAPSGLLLASLREVAVRSVGQRPFDEQLLACTALLSGSLVELDTGEGKTLVGALAAAAYALAGRRVHVLSVNDYLAERDAAWMGPVFVALGLTVGRIGHGTVDRREQYARDVVFAPVSEVGYDLLRDRFVTVPAGGVRPTQDVAIVDEADAVMIDEAMSPLVLAGASDAEPEDVAVADALIAALTPDTHFAIDADHATASLTEAGVDELERRLGGVNLYTSAHTATLTRLNLALHARTLVRRDVDYLVQDGRIALVNGARGRLAHGQRWPDGLHAAVEAKEGLAVSSPGLILDTLTVQDLLRDYTTLVGMSGTVLPVAEELAEFYDARSGRVERRLPNRRTDHPQRVFVDDEARTAAVVEAVRAHQASGQPVLVGTLSVGESERVAAALGAAGVDTAVLNARDDAHEAAVIAGAGRFGAVTISTQLSGRGTDIRLGGADEADHARVAGLGGLAVLQVGRYPSSRLDAQLRGRAGRQGDPGASHVFVSADDELVQGNAPTHLLERLRRQGGRIDQRALGRVVDQAQRIAEGARRDRHRATWDFSRAIARQRHTVLVVRGELAAGDAALAELATRIPEHVRELRGASAERAAAVANAVVLWCLDEQWCDHLAQLTEVRDGIHLQALAGVNPRDEFHRIALRTFDGFFDAAYDRAAEIVSGIGVDRLGDDPAALGLRRPSATWTYMVSDNPLGSPMDRAAHTMGRWVRSRLYRME